MADQQYFVQIRDSHDIRRGLLGSSRQIITILQRYERIKELRVMKLERVEQLKLINKEINLMIARLQKAFPASDLRVRIGSEENTTGRKRGAIGDDLGKLESELRMVEDKIGRLS
ncbi:hypothetical protein ACFL3V_01695 [Nanoarchaeota archaeon]